MATPVPNLVVIGAQKSGTTSLHSVLDTHPDIFMSAPVKEPTYFFPRDRMVQRLHNYKYTRAVDHATLLRHYMLRGYEGQAVFGESSTSYTIGDASRRLKIPARIKAQSPDCRLVYSLRNPFDRVMSAYRHALDRRNTDIFSPDNLADRPRLERVLQTSLYHYQLSAYLDDFDMSRIHLVRFEQFATDQDTVAAGLFDFLGLPAHKPARRVRSNVSDVKENTVKRKIPRAFLEHIYDPIVEDLGKLERLTGFDTTQWDLAFDTWCADG